MLNEYPMVSVWLPQYPNYHARQQLRKEGNTQGEPALNVVIDGKRWIPPEAKIKDTRSEAHMHEWAVQAYASSRVKALLPLPGATPTGRPFVKTLFCFPFRFLFYVPYNAVPSG